ncbi:MAG: 7-carboxy-7-deazaguanine synthase QueE [Bacteroidia bacterium]|nr:7-carboxy-7-deazaguanine synthase QueE [Bacteroidia bacterium]MCX7651335.1 7-carboxy-7-deazaguanine synthase QueE [Bacteroidia bacterium]MDW8417145.1 7-carboxy-7-deazaguanine synthase QueE [Bacteroidia bacterium]
MYPIVEHFYTLQGEGYWAGTPAYFIRLGGCDVGCSWCDTRHSWKKEGWPTFSPTDILGWISQTPATHIVLTGGEPTMHPLDPLISELKARGYFLQIETSGAYPPPDLPIDWVTFSPKRFKPPQPTWYHQAHELKVVIHAKSDFAWAETQRNRCKATQAHFLQPDFYNPSALQWIMDYIKLHPSWRLSMQLHRYLAIP